MSNYRFSASEACGRGELLPPDPLVHFDVLHEQGYLMRLFMWWLDWGGVVLAIIGGEHSAGDGVHQPMHRPPLCFVPLLAKANELKMPSSFVNQEGEGTSTGQVETSVSNTTEWNHVDAASLQTSMATGNTKRLQTS